MADLLILAAPLLTLTALYCLWRAGRLLALWRPATATVWRGDYGELDRQEDFWIRPDHLTSRGWDPLEADGQRNVSELVAFTDAEGNRRRATVRRQVRQGWRPDSVYTIWYDPADPTRATACGPGSWAVAAALAGGALAWIFIEGSALVAAAG